MTVFKMIEILIAAFFIGLSAGAAVRIQRSARFHKNELVKWLAFGVNFVFIMFFAGTVRGQVQDSASGPLLVGALFGLVVMVFVGFWRVKEHD